MIILIIVGVLLWLINLYIWGFVQTTMYFGAWNDNQLLLWNIFHKIMFILSIGCIGFGIYKFF